MLERPKTNWLKLYFTFRSNNREYIWTVWFALFMLEMWLVMSISCIYPAISLIDTHLNVGGPPYIDHHRRGVIAVTRVVNKTVGPGGWTKWSFVHISVWLPMSCVSENLFCHPQNLTNSIQYFLWQAYADLSPGPSLRGCISNYGLSCIPFHVYLFSSWKAPRSWRWPWTLPWKSISWGNYLVAAKSRVPILLLRSNFL